MVAAVGELGVVVVCPVVGGVVVVCGVAGLKSMTQTQKLHAEASIQAGPEAVVRWP